MLVSLYTVRVVLETLGAEDYGIYNVVAGVVAMFGFLSNAMAGATQRYLAFEIGRGDGDRLRRIFSLSLFTYILIVIIVLFFTETIGLWFINKKLIIPSERKIAILWVFQFTLISFLFTVLTSPYMAVIIAHENMSIYAYVSIIEAILKLGIVFILQRVLFDKLKLYSVLLCFVTITITIVYQSICVLKYHESRFKFYWDKKLFIEILSFSGWNLFGATVSALKNPVVNIILNQFFDPIVVASRSIATSVNNAVMSFAGNFNNALRPQIIKTYASGQKTETLRLLYSGTKGTYFLMYIIVMPLLLEAPTILALWITTPPKYTILFLRFTLIDILIESINYPIVTVAHATGNIKLYQCVANGISLLCLPLSWIALALQTPIYSVMLISIIITLIALISRIIIINRIAGFIVKEFIKEVILPISIITIITAIPLIISHYIFINRMIRLFSITSLSIIVTCICVYLIVLNKSEKYILKNILCKNNLIKGK
jgi:O-antigen/teichoic acid export membrane protein